MRDFSNRNILPSFTKEEEKKRKSRTLAPIRPPISKISKIPFTNNTRYHTLYNILETNK